MQYHTMPALPLITVARQARQKPCQYRRLTRSFLSLFKYWFCLGLMGFGSLSFAGDYYWQTAVWPAVGTTPTAACEASLARSNSEGNKYISVKFNWIHESGKRGTCQYFSIDGNVRYDVTRFGDSCPGDLVYNSKTGECDVSPPEVCTGIASQTEADNCLPRAQKGPPESCPSSYGGNPINFAIGNKFQSEYDYSASDSYSLEFSRSYNSLDGLWRHSFSTHLRIAHDAQSIALVMGHGRESFFTVSGNNVSSSSADIGVLSKTATGWQFLSGDNEHFTFDSAGKLTSWRDARGGRQDLVYTGSQVSVTDQLGNSLSFTQDDKYQPLTLTAVGVQITYGYNANKRLTAVNKTQGGQTTQRQFHYEDTRNNALLTGITDERGVRYATWSYDDQGRAITSEHANGAERIAIEYKNDGSASVTNELGKIANYEFQAILGVKRITAIEGEPSANCPMSNSTFTYDTRGLLKTKTDNKGHLTTYDYNDRGLEVSRTEAAGTPQARTITTDWHTTLFLPVTVTEPSRITHYTYDDQGRQLSQAQTDL